MKKIIGYLAVAAMTIAGIAFNSADAALIFLLGIVGICIVTFLGDS